MGRKEIEGNVSECVESVSEGKGDLQRCHTSKSSLCLLFLCHEDMTYVMAKCQQITFQSSQIAQVQDVIDYAQYILEQRTVEVVLPADPANADSEAKTVSQAGQVWFPDSAFKTAQVFVNAHYSSSDSKHSNSLNTHKHSRTHTHTQARSQIQNALAMGEKSNLKYLRDICSIG